MCVCVSCLCQGVSVARRLPRPLIKVFWLTEGPGTCCKTPAMLSTTALRVGVGVGRLGHGARIVQTRTVHKGNLAATWVNKVLDNPLPLGVGALVVGLLQLRRIREREERKAASGVKGEEVKIAEEWKVIFPYFTEFLEPGMEIKKHLLGVLLQITAPETCFESLGCRQ